MSIISLPKFTKESAVTQIQAIAQSDTAKLIVLPHAKDRMQQRDITLRQIIKVISTGARDSDIEWDTEQEKGWKCKFRRVTAGTDISVVTKLVERDDDVCLVVTVF